MYFDNWTTSLESPNLLNWMTYEQILPISLESDLLKSPTIFKIQYIKLSIGNKSFNSTKNVLNRDLEKAKKNFFSYNYKVDNFLFVPLLFLYYLDLL